MSEELSLPSDYEGKTPLTYDEIEVGKKYFYKPGLGDSSHIVTITVKNENFIRINYEDVSDKTQYKDINVNEVNKEFGEKKKNTFFNIISLTPKKGGKRKRKSRRNRKSRQNQRKKSRQSRRR